jgi:hypothetical protein
MKSGAVRVTGALLAAVILTGRAGADQAVVPLGRLVAGSDYVLIGRVASVQRDERRHVSVASVDTERNLRGHAPATLSLDALDGDVEGPAYQEGVRVLAFLKQRPNGLEVVERRAGLIEIVTESAHTSTVAILTGFLQGGANGSLAGLHASLRRDAAPPRPLVSSLLEEIATLLRPIDEPVLTEIACNQAGHYLPAAQLWAISTAGSSRRIGAKPCLEEMTSPEAPADLRLAAVEALGDLGDRRSVPLLTSLLRAPAGGARSGAERDGGDLQQAILLALGKLGDPQAVPALSAVDARGLATGSTLVHALRLIGGDEVRGPLGTLARTHPQELVRAQAQLALRGLASEEEKSR